MSTSACWRRSCSRACSTPCATRVSLDPLARNTAKPTTSWPSSLARVRASPAPSRRTAISSSRVQRPSGNAMGVAPSARTLAALPSARIDCSAPAARGRRGRWRWRSSCALTWSAPSLSASSRSARRATRTSRSTPPRRCTFCTPGTDSSSRLTTSSTNHETSTRPRLGADRVVQNGAALDIDAGDDGFLDRLGQVGADLRDGIADVIGGPARVYAQLEFHRRDGNAVGHRGRDVADAGQAGDGALHPQRDGVFQFGGRRADLGHRDRHHGKIHARIGVDRQAEKGCPAGDRQHQEQHDGGDGPTDRPGRQLHAHRAGASGCADVTMSPS